MANSAHADPALRARLDSEFNLWSDVADADGRTDWYGMQAEIARAMILDGEAIVQQIATREGLRLRIIPAAQLDSAKTVDLDGGRMIVQGVEFDAVANRVAYWIQPSRPTSAFATYAPSERVDAADICHVFKPLAPGQVRGVSWLAPIILQASDFDQLCDALLVGAKVAAMHAGFVVDQNATGAVSLDGTAGDLSEASLEPGVIRLLPAGTDIRFSSPSQTNEISAFVRLNLQSLAAGLGLPEHMLSGDLSNANYSSLRAGLLPFRARVEQIQYGILVPQILRPVWLRAMTLASLSGVLETDDFGKVEWIMPKPMQVDPAKDVQATRDMLEAGLMSRRQAVAEQGWNVETLDAEIAADKAREAELGLTFGAQTKKDTNDGK
jgi:lambda family phage portal protein